MLRCQLVNPIHGDPALMLTLPQSSERWLLDCGDLHPLSLHELQRISTVFLSHAHIDHWIGLDALLRAQLFVPRSLRIVGPAGLLQMLEGRLAGYAWNLVSGSQFCVEGYEWSQNLWKQRKFPCVRGFQAQEGGEGLPDLSGWSLKWVELEHGVPCLGYRLESPRHFRFNEDCPYPPGPWIEKIKNQLQADHLEPFLDIQGQSISTTELLPWLRPLPTDQLAYITDTRLHPAMRERIRESFGPTRLLWCEAAFLESQRELAEQKLHATASEAARLAQELDCQRLQLFHLSRRTQGKAEEHLQEAQQIFENSAVSQEFFS